MRTFVVSNREPRRRRWRYEQRDDDGKLLAAGPWETSPVRAMPCRARLAELAAADEAPEPATPARDSSSPPLGRVDVARAAADLAG